MSVYLCGFIIHRGDLPAGLWAGVWVARAVGLRPGQRRTQVVGIGLVIDGAEDQAGLVA